MVIFIRHHIEVVPTPLCPVRLDAVAEFRDFFCLQHIAHLSNTYSIFLMHSFLIKFYRGDVDLGKKACRLLKISDATVPLGDVIELFYSMGFIWISPGDFRRLSWHGKLPSHVASRLSCTCRLANHAVRSHQWISNAPRWILGRGIPGCWYLKLPTFFLLCRRSFKTECHYVVERHILI